MKNIIAAVVLISYFHSGSIAQEPKIVSDCTVFFKVSAEDAKADPQVVKSMSGSTKVVYIKGSKSRSDLITPRFRQTTLIDTKSDTIVVLREIGSTKYITYLNDNKIREQNKKYAGMQFNSTNEKKTILGYDCKKVIAKLTDGSAYHVFYAPSITPSNKEYDYRFKDLPGFVLEYESESEGGKIKIKYSAIKISLVPVPAAMFDLPKSGYRIL